MKKASTNFLNYFESLVPNEAPEKADFLWEWLKDKPEFEAESDMQFQEHWKELYRTESRRRTFSESRYLKEKKKLIELALNGKKINPGSITFNGDKNTFPWQTKYTDFDHCLGDISINFVNPPLGSEAVTIDHKTILTNLTQVKPRIICYPASWAVQLGKHPKATYQNTPIDYFKFAPTYLQIGARNLRNIVSPIAKTTEIIIPVLPSINQFERKLTEYAFAEDNTFFHPFIEENAKALFFPMLFGDGSELLNEEEIFKRFSSTMLFGYSYGCCIVLQKIAYLKKLMTDLGLNKRTKHKILNQIFCLFIAPNIDIDVFPQCPKVIVRSPLDAVVCGHTKLELYTTTRNDNSSKGIDLDAIEKMSRGQFSTIKQTHKQIKVDEKAIQFNYCLPGIVQYDTEGNKLDPFIQGKNGHDIKPYIPLLNENKTFIKILEHWKENTGRTIYD